MLDLKSKLEVRQVDSNRREITSCQGKLLLGRYIALGIEDLAGVLCIDTVERREPKAVASQIEIRERALLSEYVEPSQDLRELVSKIELVYYRNPSRTELISIRAYLRREPTDTELVNLYIKLVQEYAPKHLDRTIKLMSKC